MITTKDVLELVEFLSIVHHVKGRIRLRVSPAILKSKKAIKIDEINDLPKSIAGIKDIRVNKLAATLVITYDNDVFPFELWEDMIKGIDVERVVNIVNSLQKEAK